VRSTIASFGLALELVDLGPLPGESPRHSNSDRQALPRTRARCGRLESVHRSRGQRSLCMTLRSRVGHRRSRLHQRHDERHDLQLGRPNQHFGKTLGACRRPPLHAFSPEGGPHRAAGRPFRGAVLFARARTHAREMTPTGRGAIIPV